MIGVMQRLRAWTLAVGMVAIVGGTMGVIAQPQFASAAPAKGCVTHFLTFPNWYRGLTDGDCNIKTPGSEKDALSNFIWHIVLNVIEIALQLVIYIAIGFIIYGGFQFLTSGGDPATAAKSRMTILNAVIGLAISIGSVAIVNLILGILS
jgi:hypothetical protein